MSSIVFLNGEYVRREDALVSVEDRGFLLGDACYEASPCYAGAFFRLGDHLARLQQGLDEIRIPFEAESLRDVHHELVERNGLADRELARVYVQVTRGVAPRSHTFPSPAPVPTVYAQAAEVHRPTGDEFRRGVPAITHPDLRWAKAGIKTTGLLANVLAAQAAVEAGAVDVVLHRDGWVTEGAHNNVFAVRDGRMVTPPADGSILDGVTRRVVIELATDDGIDVAERAVSLDEVFGADELFFTGTTTEVRAAVSLDGRAIGSAEAGPLTTRVRELFVAAIATGAGHDQRIE